MSDRDKQIGETLKTLRGETSQEALADSMRERGWKWSQATVWSVEKGERPLRLAEAEDLASVLGTHLSTLTGTPIEAQIQGFMHHASAAYRGIADLTAEFLEVQMNLNYTVEQARDAGLQLRPVQANAGGWLEDNMPEDAVEVGRLEFRAKWIEKSPTDIWLDDKAAREADEAE